MGTTDDPNNPELGSGVNKEPVRQNKVYLVLSEEERKKGYVRPFRYSYIHDTCGTKTTMSYEIAETYARNPKFYGSTYCVHCCKHLSLSEFKWEDGEVVGS